MTAPTTGRPRAEADARPPAGFGALVHAEWIKFRSVRGWLAGLAVAALLTVLIGVFAAANASIGCQLNGGPVRTGRSCVPPNIAHGPGGEVVTDSLYLVAQPLTGNGSITARVTSLTGEHADLSQNAAPARDGPDLVPGLAAWGKAGIIIKAGTRPGSAYAAMLVTGGHGARMQDDYTGDTAGLPGQASAAHPRWLRLTRAGDTVTGYDSADGRRWSRVAAVTLAGLPRTVRAGLFATSPGYSVTQDSFGGSSNQGGPAQATGVFDHVRLAAAAARGTWSGTAIGAGSPLAGRGLSRAGGTFTVTGAGDIAPVTPGDDAGFPTVTVEQSLAGAFLGLIAIVVVASMFFTAEYRRGLIRTTLAAAPRRGAVLAAKAVVIGAAAFATGLAAALVSVLIGVPREESKGLVLLTVPPLTEARVIVGTAALLAVAAVFALALGAILRRGAAAITIAVVTVVLPFLLTALNAVPAGAGAWLLRLTPAAGLAIQQSIPRYPQVATALSPVRGYYPLSPWAGLAVLCLWAAAALALALVLLRRAGRVMTALRAEWTKLRTTPGPAWLLLAAAALTIAVSAAAAAATRCPPRLGCPVDPVKLSLTGVQLGQAVVAILGAAAISGEYSTGMIHVTLAAMPRRQHVLAAKALLTTGAALAAGTVAVAGSVLAGHLILPGHGFPPVALGHGPALRAAAGSVLYLALIALLSLGVAAVVRDPAAAIGAVLALLYAFPVLLAFVGSAHWQRRLERWTPTIAGLAIQDTTGLRGLAITPWAGLGVLALWAAAALLAGGLALGLRDA